MLWKYWLVLHKLVGDDTTVCVNGQGIVVHMVLVVVNVSDHVVHNVNGRGRNLVVDHVYHDPNVFLVVVHIVMQHQYQSVLVVAMVVDVLQVPIP